MLEFNDLQNILNSFFISLPVRIRAVCKYKNDNGIRIIRDIELFGDGQEALNRIYNWVDTLEDDLYESDFEYKVTIGLA